MPLPRGPRTPPGGGASKGERALNALWSFQAIESLANQLSPAAENYITVQIVGLPQADLNELYKVAISIASGTLGFVRGGKIFSGFAPNSTHVIKSSFDYIKKVVRVDIGYEQGGWKQGIVLDSSVGGLAMISRPVQGVIKFCDYPHFLQNGGFNTPGPKIPAAEGVALTNTPGKNPGLPDLNNGTYGFNSTTMTPAPLGGKCAVPPAAPPKGSAPIVLPNDLGPTGTPLVTPANLGATLRRLFDGPPAAVYTPPGDF